MMRVVALVPGGIGDQIFFLPTADALKHYYPDVLLDVIVEPRSKAAYALSKSVHEVLTFNYQEHNSLADWSNLLGMMRDREYDAVITIDQSWFTGFLLWLTGIPCRIGYQSPASVFLTNSVPYQPQQYTPAVYHDLLQPFKITTNCPELQVNLLKLDIAWSRNEQKRLGIDHRGYILINTASSLEPNYPLESWQQIIEDCQQKQPDLPVVILSNPQQQTQRLLEAGSNVKLIFTDNIGKLAAMIGGASLMLSANDVPLYLSTGLRTYTIALFGSTNPAQVLPKSDKFVAIKSPTGNIADISPTTILTQIWGN